MDDFKFFTLALDRDEGTITYLVEKIEDLEDGSVRALLMHPIAKSVLIPLSAPSKEALLLMQTQTQGKSNIQKWVEYMVANTTKILDVWDRQNVESLALLLVVNRRLTNAQKGQLSKISGKIASYHYNNDMNLVIRAIRENEALLDKYNKKSYERIMQQLGKPDKQGKMPFPSEGQRETLFNIAGFVLSQSER